MKKYIIFAAAMILSVQAGAWEVSNQLQSASQAISGAGTGFGTNYSRANTSTDGFASARVGPGYRENTVRLSASSSQYHGQANTWMHGKANTYISQNKHFCNGLDGNIMLEGGSEGFVGTVGNGHAYTYTHGHAMASITPWGKGDKKNLWTKNNSYSYTRGVNSFATSNSWENSDVSVW